MRSDQQAIGQQATSRPSFIEEARRDQIARTAIRLIAERGFARTSLAEIAREAGCSKGVILYHFKGKSDLVDEILGRLLSEPAAHVKSRVDAADGPAEKIEAYIEANFDLMQRHRDAYVALVELWGGRTSSEGRNHFETEAYAPSRRYLSRILEAGRESGALRDVPLPATASVIQGAIDGVMLQWVFDPAAVDLDACRDEIVTMIGNHLSASAPQQTDGSSTEEVQS